jgi:hypothetical protein
VWLLSALHGIRVVTHLDGRALHRVSGLRESLQARLLAEMRPVRLELARL